MRVRALAFLGAGTLEWRETADARVNGPGEAVVRPLAVATCDLDEIIVAGHSPFAPPFVIGHEGVAEVADVGDDVRSVRPGDRVLVPFQINCGSCRACRERRTGNCTRVPPASTYGFGFGDEGTRWGGFLAELIHVPYADAMLIPLPGGISPEVAASASDNITDGYRCVAPALTARPGAPVLVLGGGASGSVGLYATAQAKALGSERILYIDHDPGRRAVAEAFGAETLDGIPDRLDGSFPIAVDARGDIAGLELALNSLSRDGVCTGAAMYLDGAALSGVPLLTLYAKGTTFVTGRGHVRRDAPEVLDLIASGRLDPSPVTTRVVSFDDAADALVDGGYTKLVFTP